VCQKQIAVPNNSLLYCSEKCKREDALSSSPPLFHRSFSSTFLTENPTSAKFSSFEPSRKEQWGMTPCQIGETLPLMIPSNAHYNSSPGTSPIARTAMYRNDTSRPLPPLHPRSSGSSPRSVELVLPVYRETLSPPPVPITTHSKSLDYGRRTVERNPASTGGLKKLFHFKEMQTNHAS
jgi:ECL1/2/3 zinc binding proteins